MHIDECKQAILSCIRYTDTNFILNCWTYRIDYFRRLFTFRFCYHQFVFILFCFRFILVVQLLWWWICSINYIVVCLAILAIISHIPFSINPIKCSSIHFTPITLSILTQIFPQFLISTLVMFILKFFWRVENSSVYFIIFALFFLSFYRSLSLSLSFSILIANKRWQ